jgi:hypothetical protein
MRSGPPEAFLAERDERERLGEAVDRAEGDRQDLVPSDRLAAGRAENENGRQLGPRQGVLPKSRPELT